MKPQCLSIPAVALAVAVLVSVTMDAQTDGNYKAPRTPWGEPDLQGTYSNRTITPFERAANVNGTLLRRGLTRNSLPEGTEVIVDGYRAKNGTNRANGRDITFPDGRKLFRGSSGTGAPRDARDPSEK